MIIFNQLSTDAQFLYLLTHVSVLLLCCLQNPLVLPLAVIGEPALDLTNSQAGLSGEHHLVLRSQVWMVNIVEKPLLKNACLVRFECFHALEAVLLNLFD